MNGRVWLGWQQKFFKVTHEFKVADGITETLPSALVQRTTADNLGEDGAGFVNETSVELTDAFDKENYSDTPGKVWSFLFISLFIDLFNYFRP